MAKRISAIIGVMLYVVVSVAAADVVVVVSAGSPLDALSRTELTDIYLGRPVRLPSGQPVVPIDQAERAPAHDIFYREYLGRSAAQIKAHWSKLIFTGRGRPPQSVGDDAAMAEVIAENPDAIGYIDSDSVDDRLRVVRIE